MTYGVLLDINETDDKEIRKRNKKLCGNVNGVFSQSVVCCFVQLLHDVSLVVSRCRLLGEELRLLKMWGGLRLDILQIS